MATEAQQRLAAAFSRLTESEIKGTGFDQAGLRDGFTIVEDFVRHGEMGIAIEHLMYMVEETGITLTSASATALEELAASMGLRAPRIQPPVSGDP